MDPAIESIAFERFTHNSFPYSFKFKLPPTVYSWIEAGDVEQVYQYFATPIADLCHHIVADHEPTDLELQRLSTEITRYDLHYLEANLPADHPLLDQLSGLFYFSTFSKDNPILF